MKRGDVVLALFPNSDLITAKIRPALVVQRDSLQSGLPQVVLAAITSQMSRAGHPSRVTVLVNSPAGRAAGLVTDSVVMTDNLAAFMPQKKRELSPFLTGKVGSFCLWTKAGTVSSTFIGFGSM